MSLYLSFALLIKVILASCPTCLRLGSWTTNVSSLLATDFLSIRLASICCIIFLGLRIALWGRQTFTRHILSSDDVLDHTVHATGIAVLLIKAMRQLRRWCGWAVSPTNAEYVIRTKRVEYELLGDLPSIVIQCVLMLHMRYDELHSGSPVLVRINGSHWSSGAQPRISELVRTTCTQVLCRLSGVIISRISIKLIRAFQWAIRTLFPSSVGHMQLRNEARVILNQTYRSSGWLTQPGKYTISVTKRVSPKKFVMSIFLPSYDEVW